MTEPAKRNDLITELSRVVLEHVIEKGHLTKWLDTLGYMGGPPKKGAKHPVKPDTRVRAAKIGVEFVTQFIQRAGPAAAGTELLRELKRLEDVAEAGTSGIGPEDPDLDDEGTDLESSDVPNRGY